MGWFSDIIDEVGDFFQDELIDPIADEALRIGDKWGWNQSGSYQGGGGGGDLGTIGSPEFMQALSLFSIDPSTGLLSGPLAQPPAELAPELQAQSDRAMLRLRQQRMQEATDMQRGALGLMQSYRPGGGAALEAGVYDRTAASLRAEAAAYTPPDLLFPYREAKASEARSDAKKQANLELLVNAGAGLAQTATSAFADSLGGLGVPGGTVPIGELPVGEGVMPAGAPPAQPGPGQPAQPGTEAPAQPGEG